MCRQSLAASTDPKVEAVTLDEMAERYKKAGI